MVETNLTLIWTGIVAFAVFMYVLMDGFDGGGITAGKPGLPADRHDVPDPGHPRLYRLQHLGVRGKVTLDAGYH